jgi:hypothetical protein
LDRTGETDNLWFLAQDYLEHVYNLISNLQINWEIPEQVSRGAPNISHIMMFCWFEPVLYLYPISKLQLSETIERSGYLVVFTNNVGDTLKFKILKNDLVAVLCRSVVRSSADANHRNKRVLFKSEVQASFKLLHNNTSFVLNDSHHKYESRKNNNHVSNRTRYKADYTDQHVGSKLGLRGTT